MEQEKISESILRQAKDEAEKIISNAKKKVDKIINEGEKRLDNIKRNQKSEADNRYNMEKDRIVSAVELEIRLADLLAKKEKLDQVFESVLKKLCLRNKKYIILLEKAILSAAFTGNEIIHVNGIDRKYLTVSFLKKLSKKCNKGNGFKLAHESIEIRAGAVLSEGNIKTDASFERILEEERYYLETEVAKMLFGEGN